ncbi:hydrogenase iron-sulfur subunit, partial [Candidatus Thorarchaeota archaeon]
TNARVIRAMCSGRYHVKFVQKAFDLGAGAVLYSGCHLPADCHFQTGNQWMAKREPRIRGWMKRNNIDDERFRVEWVSAGEGKKWQAIMTDLAEVVGRVKKKPATKTKTKKTSQEKKPESKKSTATKKKAKKKTAAKKTKKG